MAKHTTSLVLTTAEQDLIEYLIAVEGHKSRSDVLRSALLHYAQSAGIRGGPLATARDERRLIPRRQRRTRESRTRPQGPRPQKKKGEGSCK